MLKSAAYLFVVAAILYQLWRMANVIQPKETITTSTPHEEYDYVIVGGGTAGCVLANRLSADGKSRVVLLEAGGDDLANPLVHIPMAMLALQQTEMDWDYTTVKQQGACLSSPNSECSCPRGKLLGGSSGINAMFYIRGSKHDFDRWEEMGAKGWSYKDVLAYFKRSEKNTNPAMVASGYHGDSGPLVINDMNVTKTGDLFIKGGVELGYSEGDVNGEDMDGVFMHCQANINGGVRWSTAAAYLRPAMERRNLDIVTNAHVTQILTQGKRATGVEFRLNGVTKSIQAKREVILSAGAIGSPQILMLSGIGPKDHLGTLDIPPVVDLPVGNNLQDHMLVILPYTTEEPLGFNGEDTESYVTLLKYLLFGTGALSNPAGMSGSAFFTTQTQPKEDKFPYMQFHVYNILLGTSSESLDVVTKTLHAKPDIMKEIHGGVEGRYGFNLLPTLLHFKNPGTVRLRSKNPTDHPLIDPNYLSHSSDIKNFLEGIRLAQKLANTTAFKKVGSKPHPGIHPDCRSHGYDSDAYWECFVRHTAHTVFHHSGTCKMGDANDPNAVVDPSLKVIGIEGLRVVDASVMPMVVSGNTHAATIMIAEKAADIILGDM